MDYNFYINIIFKSTPENWFKEYDGRKPNTLRKIDADDVRFKTLREHALKNDYTDLYISINNTEDGRQFARKVTDYTEWDGYAIISWRHEQ